MGRRYTEEQLKVIMNKVHDNDALNIILESDNPILWAENHLSDPDTGENKIKIKKAFYDVLLSRSKNRALRVGRQFGKTVHMVVDMAHTAYFNKNIVIYVFIPNKKQLNRILEIFGNMLRNSDIADAFSMGNSGKKKKKKSSIEAEYDYEIQCASGSSIRVFLMGQNPAKARGQSMHGNGAIYIDEVEYLPEKAFGVITGLVKGGPNTPIWASSTPSGLPDTWFRIFCDNAVALNNDEAKEFHLPTTLDENWPVIEKRLRSVIFDEVTWKLEVLAEWADAIGAVYKKDIIDKAIENSKIFDQYFTMEELRVTQEYQDADKFLGVDWNVPQNGVRVIEVAKMFDKFFITRHEIISHEQYTQIYTVQRIMELYKQFNYKTISVDAGYGATQIELLHAELNKINKNPEQILTVVDSVKKVKRTLSESDDNARIELDIRVRHYMVNLLGIYLENKLALPIEEDVRQGLVAEIRAFKRKKSQNEFGGFEYSDNTHSLSALQICIYGIDEYYRKDTVEENNDIINIESVLMSNVIQSIQNKREHVATNNSIWRRTLHNNRTGGLDGSNRRRII